MERLHISFSELLAVKNGEIYYTHSKKKNRSSALSAEECSEIELRIPRNLGALSLKIELFDESCKIIKSTFDAEHEGVCGAFDVYKLILKKRSLAPALYFYKITLSTILGEVFGRGNAYNLYFSEKEFDFFQLSVSDFSNDKTNDFAGGIIYHIFVDRFSKDENVKPKDGAVIAENWDVIPEYPEYPGAFLKNNTFYGGTLNSAAKRLDYIKSLGVTIVYLSPIFESPSNHKYDTADYMKVDSMFGGDEALQNFINQAKKRGISVILDGVFNHTGADSVYFNRFGTYGETGAFQSKESEYYPWYNFKSYPEVYESWWGIDILPRINTGNKSFEDFILNKVINKYRSMGIAGLRLDVADELSDEFIKKIKSALDKDSASVLYGEVWEDASNKIAYEKRKSYFLGGELDGVMNYPLRAGIIDFFRNKSADKLRYALTDIINNAPKRIRDLQMNILGTHDTERILTAIGAEKACGKSNKELATLKMTKTQCELAEDLLLSAYTVLATLPGIPAVFYGDEVGMQGYSDPFNRMPYPERISKKILKHYKKIGQIRKSNHVYKGGEYNLISLTNDFLAFSRYDGVYSYITITNNSSNRLEVEFSSKADELIDNKKANKHIIPRNSSSIFKTRDDEFSVCAIQEV